MLKMEQVLMQRTSWRRFFGKLLIAKPVITFYPFYWTPVLIVSAQKHAPVV
jgi:hypothetical protein